MASIEFADNTILKSQILSKDPDFWKNLAERTNQTSDFSEVSVLSTFRRKALSKGFLPAQEARTQIKLAVIGGCTFHPLSDLILHFLFVNGYDCELWLGDYDNYIWEVMDESSGLYSFNPDFVLLIPPVWRYRYSGKLTDPQTLVEEEISRNCKDILDLCNRINTGCGAEVILCNFILPCYHDPGSIRTRTLASEWNSLKSLNMQIGLQAPNYVSICDLEFLAARTGGLQARDDRGWFETKQPFSTDFAVHAANEIMHTIQAAKAPAKKVLVVDLDETLWGGIIGDDGLNGIEIGSSSPRGECFKEFQRIIKNLQERGILLAVCSKNELENALAPFEKHPEMHLRRDDFVSFQANWNPKADNMAQIAAELNLSMDSFVFVDDNPAEIEMVRQFAPAVSGICLGSDPSFFIRLLKDSRFFEPRNITEEDLVRSQQYKNDEKRMGLLTSSTDINTYLESLQMVAYANDFHPIDVPRLAQLINKSNQFNLTTHRRTESEVTELIGSDHVALSFRLTDRFGDLGIISIVIAKVVEEVLEIDTWLMSCRVLKRQMEHVVLNELMARAAQLKCGKVKGLYIPTSKNQMVKDFYTNMGFAVTSSETDQTEYELITSEFEPFSTKISVIRGSNDKS